MHSIQFFITLLFILCLFSTSNTIHAQQDTQPTSTMAMTNTPTGTTQSIIGTPLPNATNNNNNNSSAAANGAGPTNAQTGHGAMMTPSQAAAPHSSLSPSSSGGISNTTRPPQVAPFPDDTVGKNGRLRVSSMGSVLTPDPSSFIMLFFVSFLYLSLIE